MFVKIAEVELRATAAEAVIAGTGHTADKAGIAHTVVDNIVDTVAGTIDQLQRVLAVAKQAGPEAALAHQKGNVELVLQRVAAIVLQALADLAQQDTVVHPAFPLEPPDYYLGLHQVH